MNHFIRAVVVVSIVATTLAFVVLIWQLWTVSASMDGAADELIQHVSTKHAVNIADEHVLAVFSPKRLDRSIVTSYFVFAIVEFAVLVLSLLLIRRTQRDGVPPRPTAVSIVPEEN